MPKKSKRPNIRSKTRTHQAGVTDNLTTTHQSLPDETPVIAKPLIRVTALLYDGMLILAMLFLVGAIGAVVGTLLLMEVGTNSTHAQRLPTWYQNAVMTPLFVLTLIGFYGVFWRKSGQTLGMQTWRLKTVDDKGRLLTWSKSTHRIISACLLPLLFAVIGGIFHGSRLAILFSAMLGFLFNYTFCLLNSRGLAVHDILSNTLTLKVPKIEHESLWQSWRKKKNISHDT